jgi:predicted branched-subunit amino acid permease
MKSLFSPPPLVADTAPAPPGELAAGARAALPLLLGLSPFALSIGAAVGASTDPTAAWAGTLLIFSGSGQAALLEALHGGAPVWSAVLITALVNARLVVYSTALAPLWRDAPWWRKLLGAAAVVEPTWVIAEQRRSSGASPGGARAHYAGAAGATAAGWLAMVTLGTLVGGSASVTGRLAVAVPLCLVVLIVPHLRRPGGVAAVAAAAGAAVCGRLLLPGSEILIAMAAAGVAGAAVQRRRPT